MKAFPAIWQFSFCCNLFWETLLKVSWKFRYVMSAGCGYWSPSKTLSGCWARIFLHRKPDCILPNSLFMFGLSDCMFSCRLSISISILRWKSDSSASSSGIPRKSLLVDKVYPGKPGGLLAQQQLTHLSLCSYNCHVSSFRPPAWVLLFHI